MTPSLSAFDSGRVFNSRAFGTLFFSLIVLGFPCFTLAAEMASEHEANTVGLFVGAARDHRDNGLALGIEYEHRFTASFGLGALAEYTSGDLNTWVYAMPLAYHRGPWKFYAGPGIEWHNGENEPLVRFGAEYGFHFESWEVSPQVDFDIVGDEEVFVIGVTFARGF